MVVLWDNEAELVESEMVVAIYVYVVEIRGNQQG